MNTPQLITVTDVAANRIKTLIEKSGQSYVGLRVSVNSKGCSGLSYVFEYAEAKKKLEEEYGPINIDLQTGEYTIVEVEDKK